MVSVIIPVYNVFHYIDQCLTSVVGQTYSDLEILLINDGSTDGSEEKCRVWAERDARICFVSKQNEGLGPTRTHGIRMAQGEYLFFVDSDDWLEKNAIELLVGKAEEQEADIVFCNRYLVMSDGNGDRKNVPYSIPILIDGSTNAEETPELIYRSDTATWDKLYRRSLWTESKLEQPAHPYEDTPVIPLLVARAKRIAKVNECLYYYFLDRPGNITGKSENLSYIIDSLRELKENAERLGIFWRWYEELKRYSAWMTKSVSFHLRRNTGESYSRHEADLLERVYAFMDQAYPSWNDLLRKHVIVWGSYNLRSIAAKQMLDIKQLSHHFCFSSIMSVDNKGRAEVKHFNAFRESMLKQDMEGSFARLTYEEVQGVSLFYLDFLEERFDLVQEAGSFYTKSDAYEETGMAAPKVVRREELPNTLWEEKCLRFIALLRRYFQPEQVVLVRTRLCETYGRTAGMQSFAQAEEIRKTNARIQGYEDFFLAQFPGVHIIETEDERLLFTDSEFPHGCYPWHINEYWYFKMADQIERQLTEGFYVIFGCGADGREALHRIGVEKVRGFVDSAPERGKETICGKQVHYFGDYLEEMRRGTVIVASRNYYLQMQEQLLAHGIFRFETLYDWQVKKNFAGRSRRGIVLLNNPEHGNLGDHGITLAERSFFGDYFADYPLLEVTDRQYKYARETVRRQIRADDLLVVSGGGYLGTLWMEDGEVLVRQIIEDFPEHPILILPQTVYYEATPEGLRELEESRKIYGGHSNLSICLRDRQSYEFMKEKFTPNARYYLFPDMVGYLRYSGTQERRGAAIVLRSDCESVVGEQTARIKELLERQELPWTELSMFAKGTTVCQEDSKAQVKAKLTELTGYRLVITDRLHCMLFCAVSGTPCLAFPNLTGKVDGSYAWLARLPYLRLVKRADEIPEALASLELNKDWAYPEGFLKPYFEQLAEVVRGLL